MTRPSEVERDRRARELMREAVMKAVMNQVASALKRQASSASVSPAASPVLAPRQEASREAAINEAPQQASGPHPPTVGSQPPAAGAAPASGSVSAQRAPSSGDVAAGTMDVATTIGAAAPEEQAAIPPPTAEGERMKSAIDEASTRLAREALLKTALGGAEPAPSPEQTPPPERGRPAVPSAVSERLPTPLPGTLSGIQVVVDGTVASLERPPIVEQGTLLVPLKDVASALGYSVINLGQGNIQLISPDGETKSLTLTSKDPALLMSEEELRGHLALRTRYDETDRTLYLQSPSPPSFRSYTIPKSAEQLQAEEASKKLVEQVERSDEDSKSIPEAAKPSIVLNGHVTYSYDHPHATAPFRSLTTAASGQVYGWDTAYESVRKDISGVFQHDYSFLNLRKPGFFIGAFDQQTDLAPLRSQFEGFNGLKVRKTWGEQSAGVNGALPYRPLELQADERSATTLAWGQTEQSVSGTNGTVTYLGDLYEAKHEWAPADWLRLKGAFFYLNNEANYLEYSGTSGFPRTNLVPFGDIGVRLPGEAWLSAQLAHSDYRPDNQPDTSVEDWNWRTAFDWQKPRYRLKIAYEFVGKDYASIGNPRTYQDYKGLTAFGSYRLTDRWSVSSSLLRYRNNLNDDPNDTTNQNQALSFSTSFQPWRDQSLSLRFSHLASNPEGGPSPGSSSHSRSYGLDYSLPFLMKTRALASYDYFRTEEPAGSDSESHAAGTTLFKSFGRGSNWSVSERLRKEFRELEEDTVNLDTSLNLSLQLSPALASYATGSYVRDLTDGSEHRNTLATALGLRANTVADTTLGLEYKIGPYDLDTERGRWPRNWSVLFLVTKRFGISSPPNFGSIEGVVFQDLNGNSVLDAGEAGAEEVVVSLADGQRKTLTDAQGRFAFARVAPGSQAIHLDISNLDPTWTIPEPRRTVAVRGHRAARLAFPLVKGGAIQGRVFIDNNNDAVCQETEEPLESVAVILLPGEDFRRTDTDGLFQFDYLVPGAYTVKIYRDDIPGGYEPASPETVAVTVMPGQVTEPVTFAVRLVSPVQKF